MARRTLSKSNLKGGQRNDPNRRKVTSHSQRREGTILLENPPPPQGRVDVRFEVPSSGMNPINNEGPVTDYTSGSQKAKLS